MAAGFIQPYKPPRKGLSIPRAEVARAIRAAKGFKTNACRALGITTRTLDHYLARYPSLMKVFIEAKEALKDRAENELAKHIEEGSLNAITYYLNTQARDRGYGDVHKYEHSGIPAGRGTAELTVVNFEKAIEEYAPAFERALQRAKQAFDNPSDLKAPTLPDVDSEYQAGLTADNGRKKATADHGGPKNGT